MSLDSHSSSPFLNVTGEDGTLTLGAAAPPPDAGPQPGRAGPPRDSFEELWEAYGVYREYLASRTVYEKIAPDDLMHATLVAAARRWAAGYDAIDRQPEFRKPLNTWLSGMHFREDPPTRNFGPAEAKERGSDLVTKGTPNNDPATAIPAERTPAPQVRWETVTINEAATEGNDIERRLVVRMTGSDRWISTIRVFS